MLACNKRPTSTKAIYTTSLVYIDNVRGFVKLHNLDIIFLIFFNNIVYSGKVLVQLLVLITCQIRKDSSNIIIVYDIIAESITVCFTLSGIYNSYLKSYKSCK